VTTEAAVPQDDPVRCGLSWAAKVVSSGVHITGRKPVEVLRASCAWMALPDEALRQALQHKDPSVIFGLKVDIDLAADGTTTLAMDDGPRRVLAHARFIPGLGSVVLPNADAVPPVQAAPSTADRAFDTRPTEALPPAEPLPAARQALLDEAVAMMFARQAQFTNAFVVLHRGRVLAERYAAPFDAQTRFESWSMGKSIAASLVGRLHQQGRLALDEPAWMPQWQAPGDPRQRIRVRDLLNMASGLRFSGSYSSGEDEWRKAQPAQAGQGARFLDHIYVYAGGIDSCAFSAAPPLEAPPGTLGRYRNCDPLLATALVRLRTCGDDHAAFARWVQTDLFHLIGAHGIVIEPDPHGHLLISGHDYGRARDWARLGQLYLQRGAWEAEQVLAEDFVQFVQTPNPAWAHEPYYGGFFITNNTGVLPTLPKDAFWMSGGGGQRVIVVPSLDLVVVRMGHMAGEIFGRKDTMDRALGLVRQAVEA
jgi:CubicO group peptidase (beta-lactamase class C family)